MRPASAREGVHLNIMCNLEGENKTDDFCQTVPSGWWPLTFET